MEEFMRQVRDAELLIMHAGAGSILHAAEAGKIPVVMPRRAARGEHVNDHQVELAQALAQAGKVVLADGPDDLARAAREALALQRKMPRRDAGENGDPPLRLATAVETLLNDYARQLASRRA